MHRKVIIPSLFLSIFFVILFLGIQIVPRAFYEIKDYVLQAKTVFAAGPVISGVTVDSISHTTARIQWTASVPSSATRVMYDSLTDTAPFANSTQIKNGAAKTQQGYTLGGLAPATLYYFKACSTSAETSEETCGPVSSFTTLAAPLDRFRNPTLPDAPELPPMPTINGETFTVANDCSDLQSILNQVGALTGSTNHQILINPSTRCVGNYRLPDRAGTGWIVVRSSASDDDLPGEGVRVNDSYEEYMPTLSALDAYPNALGGALYINNVTSKWRFVGLKFTSEEGSRGALVTMWHGQTSDMIFDRNIFFSDGSNGEDVSTSIFANGIDTVIANNSITNIRPGNLSIAVEISTAQGFTLDNNYINAPGISVFSEEDAPAGINAVQGSDYKITRNLFEWDKAYTENSVVRQHLEFKAGNRILIDGNIFTSEWSGGQTGSFSNAIIFTPRNGMSPNGFDNYISDVTLTNNTFYDVPGGINLAGAQNNLVVTDVPATKRVLIQNNLFYDMSGFHAKSGIATAGSPFYFDYALEDVVVNHNTVFDHRGTFPATLAWQGGPGSGIKVTNNILAANYNNGYGNIIWGVDTSGQLPAPPGISSTLLSFQGFTQSSPNTDPTLSVTNNLLLPGVIDTTSDSYYSDPSKSYSPASCTTYWSGLGTNTCAGSDATDTANEVFASVGFAGPYSTTTDFRLASNSPYKNSAEGGEDPGVDIDALLAAQATLQEDNTDPIDPVVPPPPSGGGGSSRSSHSSSGGSSNVPVPPLVVPSPVYTAPLFPNSTANINTSSLPLSSLYFYLNLYKGKENSEVLNLQKILVSEGFLSASSQTGYFGELTEAAVKSFQKKYGIATVSTPGYGEVGPATRSRLNAIVALATGGKAIAALPPPTPPSNLFISSRAWITKKLSINIKDPEVTLLQQFLIDQGLAKGTPTGFFGALTEESVRLFQKKYGIVSGGSALTTGFGVVGPKTREKINEMMGE